MHSFEFEEMKTEGKETQMVFDILANRGHDALSHIGMAREICAIEGRKFANGDPISKMEIQSPKRCLNVNIEDSKLCRRYIGVVLENVEVKPSPKWIQDRLLVSGVKPINNVVDVTNYVMLENGQPLHAFDAGKIGGKGGSTSNWRLNLQVHRAKKNEKIKLLDEKEYILNENDIVIADPEKAIALAGVMGGFDSAINDKTTSIILESANFNPTMIRKTRTRLNLGTESSYRFEREIDPNLAEIAMARAIELLQKYGGNNVKMVVYADIYPKKIKPWNVRLDENYVKNLLGENIPSAKMKNILENLGIDVKMQKNILNCEIPTRRLDLKTQEDLIEEIARIYGYENIPAKPPVVELTSPSINKQRIFEDKLRDAMIALGFSEMMNYSFYSADDIEKCNLKMEAHFEVANPMNPDQQYMRWSLAPNILKNVALNLKNFSDVKIFEIGNKFCLEKSKAKEATVLVGAMTYKSAKENLFFELKGVIESLLEKTGYENVSFEKMTKDYIFWHESRSAEIKIEGKEMGRVGEINPQVLRDYGIKSRVFLFGIRTYELISQVGYPKEKEKIYNPISKFPSLKRDISMFVDEKTKYADIESKIYSAGGKLVLGVELFDIFEKESEKSLALRIEIGSREKTLTSEEIDEVMKKIVTKLEKDLKVKVRK
jgi:phenylalanyl-tRNA synthetase beta chain